MGASAALRQRMTDDSGAVFETVAEEMAATCREVVEALPEEMRRFADGAAFQTVMDDISKWGPVTFIVHTKDGIFEFSGSVPGGKVARGYYNLSGRVGLHGHLREDRCAAIAFVERAFMGRQSAVVVFFNLDGGIMFKVFVGRTTEGDLLPDQLAFFRALADANADPES